MIPQLTTVVTARVTFDAVDIAGEDVLIVTSAVFHKSVWKNQQHGAVSMDL